MATIIIRQGFIPLGCVRFIFYLETMTIRLSAKQGIPISSIKLCEFFYHASISSRRPQYGTCENLTKNFFFFYYIWWGQETMKQETWHFCHQQNGEFCSYVWGIFFSLKRAIYANNQLKLRKCICGDLHT